MISKVLAGRMHNIPFSGIRKVFEEVTRLENAGKHIINLCIGRPDFDTPKHIKEEAKKALDEGLVHYTSNYGLEELRRAIVEKIKTENGINCRMPNVIVTVGANEAVFLGMAALLNPGDEVIIPNPAWLHYFYCAELVGAKCVSVPLREKNSFQLDADDLSAVITPQTKMIIINTPHNPTGAVFTREALQKVAELAQKHDLVVVADEIYEKLIYDHAQHISIASFPGMSDRTLTVNGFSKAYSMTGWRVGYAVGSDEFISGMIRVHQYTTTCATSFAQKGAWGALTGTSKTTEKMRNEFDRRRRLLVEGVNSISKLSCILPYGAFYTMINVKDLSMTSEEASKFFLQKAGVAMVPGSAFGEFGEGYLRAAYSNSYENIEEAINRIRSALA